VEDSKIRVFDLEAPDKYWLLDVKEAHSLRGNTFDVWHDSLRIILISMFSPEPSILVQRRSRFKINNKRKLDISFASHFYDYQTAREVLDHRLKKETGLLGADIGNLVNAGKSLEVTFHNNKEEKRKDRTVVSTLWASFNKDIETLKWDPKEVESLWLIKLSDFTKIINGESVEIKGFDGKTIVKELVSMENFAQRYGKFYNKLLIMSERYIKGKDIAF